MYLPASRLLSLWGTSGFRGRSQERGCAYLPPSPWCWFAGCDLVHNPTHAGWDNGARLRIRLLSFCV
jgi:hypothetical protein